MPTLRWNPLLLRPPPSAAAARRPKLNILQFSPRRSRFTLSRPLRISNPPIIRASLAPAPSLDTDADAELLYADAELLYAETFPLKRRNTVEGTVRVSFRLEGERWRLAVRCDMVGRWLLHWGVTYCDDFGSEWDQPPPDMRPPGSVPIKDYAIETPMEKSPSASEGKTHYEVQMDIDNNSDIGAIHFVLKDGETGAWFQHKGRDFRIPLKGNLEENYDVVGGNQGFSIWPGAFGQISSLLSKPGGSHSKSKETVIDTKDTSDAIHQKRPFVEFNEEYSILKEEFVQNHMTVTVKGSKETENILVHFDTDIPGDVVVHWGVCRDSKKKWEIPATPLPPATRTFRRKALQTLLQPKSNGIGNWGLFPVDKEISGVLFVLKLNEYMWLNNVGTDFYIPLDLQSTVSDHSRSTEEAEKAIYQAANTKEIVNEIRNLVTDISTEKKKGTKGKKAEGILQEIEKLAAEAYSIFRSSVKLEEESALDAESLKPAVGVCSGTGTGHEILCQGFNWESHKSGRWYSELNAKASELSSLGFTILWLPPPTESVSPEGYMPKDLYNLNSRYGNMEELKEVVQKFHKVGIKVLGDVVLNHRCAHYQNKNGVWNLFGGRLNWDDRAIVADDPHFQGRGNKSSGDSFHAAPNIDHSQDFVRKDLKEWLCWLRQEVGYDGWRLDFVRGFWGGYVKDYLEATEPYFAVGEYWDSLSYTYGQMDHNQDAHRQRIIDWIGATGGSAGAFDVTTKGILHTVLEKCEYWRLSDQKGKPPGVLGWWPSRAVTFIENHDTGSTQGHWRFPAGKEMQGYAYILTHPGTPAVFFDHIFSHYHQEISRLISLRHRAKIHCRSTIKITKAERDVYAAEIDEKVVVKIGPGYYEPTNGPKDWNLAFEGRDYKIWEAL